MIAEFALIWLLAGGRPGPGPSPNGPCGAHGASICEVTAPAASAAKWGREVPPRATPPVRRAFDVWVRSTRERVVGAAPGFPPPRPLALPPSASSSPRSLLPADTPVARARRKPEGPDRWFAQDKLKHFLMSFTVTSFGYAMARAAGIEHRDAIVAGVAAGAAAGVWKEARDRATGGDVSARDLVWDALGVVAGGVVDGQTR